MLIKISDSDPLPFQWLARDPELCANTKFIDVDYELLMETKRKIVRETPKMRDLLHPFNSDATGNDPSVLIDSEEYAAVGCDLRNIPRLERLLRNVVDIDNCLVLCVAEVSITYMQTQAADALISWSSSLSPDVSFCLLEQCSPDQMDNPFTMTMLKHFAKLGTPLRSVLEYPGEHTQKLRFRQAGYTKIEYSNLWELWSDPRFLSPSQRIALDQVEPFDEWEEFALFASHYCLVVAHNRDEALLTERPILRRDSNASMASDISARTPSPHRPSKEWFGLGYTKEPGDLSQRHHGSAYMIPDQDAIGVHGGIGPRSRLSTTAVVRPRHYKDGPPIVPPPDIAARCCHTITPLDTGQNFLVGGRASPSSVYKDCWLQTGSVWERVHDLPEPRYRHRVVPVVLPNQQSGAICLGGKIDPCNVATDVLLWEPDKGWRTLRTHGPDPVPRFGALFMRIGYNHGLLFGGLRQDGVVCQGFWRWKLMIRNNELVHISFRTSTAVDASVGAWSCFPRFGASYSIQRDEVLMIGGISKSGCLPKPYEILSIIGCFSNYKDTEHELPLRVQAVNPSRSPDCPRPFLVGHSTHRTRSGNAITIGGGATCFSFGNYFNTGVWVLYDREAGLQEDWAIVPVKPADTTISKPQLKVSNAISNEKSSQIVAVEEKTVQNSEDFVDMMYWDRPQILKSLDFGPCVQKWTSSYLRERISSERSVVVHDAQQANMNFRRKNFTYRTVLFHQLLQELNDRSSHLYLRSLSSASPASAPANINTDWPEIASDFSIPPPLKGIKENIHSSPLRISNDISMWLHYDVMDNVLFQIRGIKKLALFPPKDIVKLSFPPGSTTSELDLFNNFEAGKEYDLSIPTDTNPIIAILRPGDALYIPPLWAHTGVSLPSDLMSHWTTNGVSETTQPGGIEKRPVPTMINGSAGSNTAVSLPAHASASHQNPFVNIAVNVFFRSLPASAYAAGRDVYGNRHLACYEDGRKMVEKIVNRFKSSDQKPDSRTPSSSATRDWIPIDIRKAYLLQLAKELKEAAEAL